MEAQKLSVTYGAFSCEVIGYDDPFPPAQTVLAEYQKTAWRFPGYVGGDRAQRVALGKLVASRLNAAVADQGIAVGADAETGGFVVTPAKGAGKAAKPETEEKPAAKAEKAAAAVAGATAALEAVEAPESAPEAEKSEAAAELDAKTAAEAPAKPAVEAEKDAAATGEATEVEPEALEAETADSKTAKVDAEEVAETKAEVPAEADAAKDAAASEIADKAAKKEAAEPVEDSKPEKAAKGRDEAAETPRRPPVSPLRPNRGGGSWGSARARAAEETAKAKVDEESPKAKADKETAAAKVDRKPAADAEAAAQSDPEPNLAPIAPPAAIEASDMDEPAGPERDIAVDPEDDEDIAAAQAAREALAAQVTDEIRESLAEFEASERKTAQTGGPLGDRSSGKAAPVDGEKPRGLFSRFLGGKKKPAPDGKIDDKIDARLEALAPTARSEPPKPPAPRDDGALRLTEKDKAPPAAPVDDADAPDPIFEPAGRETPAATPAASGAAEPPKGSLEKLALMRADEAATTSEAKARVLERMRDRKLTAQQQEQERKLRIIRREHVEEREKEVAEAAANQMSVADFARMVGAASLDEKMEACAAYATLIARKHKFTRAEILDVINELDREKNFSSEARIKAFGKMLRTGVLLRVDDGLFAMAQIFRSPYELKLRA